MKKNDKKTQIKILNIILIIIWMIIIFNFSGQIGTESGNTSRKFTVQIIKIITGKNLSINEPFVDNIQSIIRKLAHFSIYTIGGFLIMNYQYETNKKEYKKIIYSIIFGGSYAITDEIHQVFVPGRSGNIFDVGIDTLGVITGVFVYLAVRKIIEKVTVNRRIKDV